MSLFEHKPKHHFSPKSFFLHIGALVSLYASVALFLTLVYGIITLSVGESYYIPGTLSSIRFGVAGVIVAFPLYIVLSRFLGNMYRDDKHTIHSLVKKWAGFLTLFLAGIALAIDLMVTIFTFLEGDTTLSFILKALAVLIVFGSVFYYQLADIRREKYSDTTFSKRFASITALVVVVFIIAGFMHAGSPGEVRKQERDQERIDDLWSIQWEITSHWQEKGSIPESLDDLIDPLSGRSIPEDPNGGDYVYTKTGEKTFTLCATFESEYTEDEFNTTRDAYYPYNEDDQFFLHGIGETCFDREIDEDIYPIFDDEARPLPALKY